MGFGFPGSTCVDASLVANEVSMVCAQATVQNTSYPIFLQKVNGSGAQISGAVFEVYQGDPKAGGVKLTNGVTSANANYTINGLPQNVDLWLVETKAPAGQELLAEPIRFRLETSSVQGITLAPGQTGATKVTSTQLRISNVSMQNALPFVGGKGADEMMLLSAMLMLCIAVGYRIRRCRGFGESSW